jgi:hypothetical protein
MTQAKKSEDKKYSKLMGKIDYDHEAVEQLADALNEIDELNQRVNQLKQLVEENQELHQFVWRTATSGVYAVHNIEDDHLTNIMMHTLRNGQAIPRAIRGEAMQRGLVIPTTVSIDWTSKVLSLGDREDVI